jgi:hypothetical protein
MDTKEKDLKAFPVRLNTASRFLFRAEIDAFDVFSKSDSGSIPLPCAPPALSTVFRIVAPLRRNA